MSRPDNYKLEIDSFLRITYSQEAYEKQANFRALIPAPANSEESGDEKFLYDTSADEVEIVDDEYYEETSDRTPIKSKKNKSSAKSKLKQIDPELMMISNFDITVLRDYPNKQKFSEVPMKVLKI